MADHSVVKGDTSPIRRVRIENVNIAGVVCKQAVWKSLNDSAPAIAEAAVTDQVPVGGFDWFRCYLTPTQTDTLAPGSYTWVIQLYAAGESPPVRAELHDSLVITKPGILS